MEVVDAKAMGNKISITLPYSEDIEAALTKKCPKWVDYRVLSKSLDARGANRGKGPKYHYLIECIKEGETFSSYQETFPDLGPFKNPPIIIGAGPGGLFCALRLAEYGIPSLIFERGEAAHNRMKKIARFWRYGEFDKENNVCYGEGGAGLFSDGKLITRIKSPFVKYVMKRFVTFGAPEETAYISNPHLGSNKIRNLISKLTDYLKEKKCKIFYNSKVEKILVDKNGKTEGVELSNGKRFYSSHVVLATGHSPQDMFSHLNDLGVSMKSKDFAVGVRIEHPRKLIDHIQLGKFAEEKSLGSARYRLSYHNSSTQKGTYSFCMCPGGYVLSSGTEEDGIVVNGMSNYARNSRWSNSALVVSVKAGKDFSTSKGPLEGLHFQREIEKRAFSFSKEKASGKELPAQRLKDFLDQKQSLNKLSKTSTPSGLFPLSMNQVLPNFVVEHLHESFQSFEKSLGGFCFDDALLIAPETRTSSPVTIERDKETLESPSHEGLYPCGEGAGHAGGITSAAVDGVKIAMSLIKKEKCFEA